MDSKVEQLHSRANFLVAEFEEGGGTDYIDEAIVLDREALELCPPGHPLRSGSLSWLAIHLFSRYKQLGAMADLDEVVVFDQEALQLRPPGHAHRSVSLISLASHLSTRYKQLGKTEDLDEAIVLGQEALTLCPPGHPDRPASLNNHVGDLATRYMQLGGMEDLDEAIAITREALEPEHPHRSASLNNLALYLSYRHDQLGAMTDLDEAIALAREALVLCPPGHPDRSGNLNNLALHLSTRYKKLGAREDLDEAIVLARDALVLLPRGHPDRSMSLTNLAVHLYKRYQQLGAIEDLNEAIVLDQDALALRPPGHPNRSASLNNLANRLSTRYEQLGSVEDLNEAVVLNREAVVLRPPGHPERSMSLNNLANRLATRYQQLGAIEDLDEAIVLDRDALVLRPPGHPDRAMTLNNFAARLSMRYRQLGAIEDLDQAVILGRDALALLPPGHPERAMSLNNIAVHLSNRHNHLGAIEDLSEAIVLDRDALALRPPGHPERSKSLNNLAARLCNRYKELGTMEDLDEAIVLGRDALALRPPSHPDRSTSLNNLAIRLSTRFTRLGQLKDKEEIFSLYAELAHVPQMVSSSDLSAARGWIRAAERFHHPTGLLAYETSLRYLIQHLNILPPLPQHLNVLKNLTLSLGVDAFSACLRNGSPTDAVELLEQGRGVFWSQLARLRSPPDDIIASSPAGKKLADKFMQLTSFIRHALGSPDGDQHERVCHLSIELERVVTHIRELPGSSHFLLPSLFADLQQAASGGPVIIVNASQYSCDALVVLLDRDPVHIPLQITRKFVRDLSTELHTLTVRAKRVDVTRELASLLRKLWDDVVSHIVDFLRTVYPCQSRIWWCPTAEFSVLPLHAAGPYRKGQQNLSDLYISSYTPTLTALIRARRPGPSNRVTEGKRFLVIGQAKAVGLSELLSVGTELANIDRRIDGLAKFTRIEGHECCISRVSEELSKNDWVHFACHALPNRKHPFDSAFTLHDGHFSIQRLIQCELDNPQFAYLSASHTTVGDEKSPDEVIHLASAMQFAGFRSVIGTMWAVDDGETNKITSMFYDNMVDEEGRLDHTRAAFALHKTMRKLVDLPLDQRILYIHIGA